MRWIKGWWPACCLLGVVSLIGAAQGAERPRLILQITVDQLRGDLLPRYRDRFGTGGFRRLLDQGVWYSNAHYGTSNTYTCAGHAVVTTGADTAQHGIVGNEWFDRELGKPMYCAFDPRYPVLGEKPGDKTGMSPVHLTATTFGDELMNATGGRSRVFAVAGKDRSAIMPGGHFGKAFWYSDNIGKFVTSTYYYPQLPEWVERWNKKQNPEKKYREWSLSRDPRTYLFAKSAAEPVHPNKAVNRKFPRKLDAAGGKAFYSALPFTPMLDEYTTEFVRELLVKERLGQETTDYLSVSFSSTDYVGHFFSPNSVESEDNLIKLDATLAALFEFVDRHVGAGRTLIVLSADHGVDDAPEDRAEHGVESGRWLNSPVIVDGANDFLKRRFKVDANLLAGYTPPGLYLNQKAIETAKLDFGTVEKALAEFGRGLPGIAYALTRTDLIHGNVARTPLMDSIERGFHPERSGDVTLIQAPFWYVDTKSDRYASTHGSPYTYDTHIPVIFQGPGIEARTIYRRVEPQSIAPTLSALMQIRPPSAAFAPVLLEVVGEK